MSQRTTTRLLAVLAIAMLGVVAFRPGAGSPAAGPDSRAQAGRVTMSRGTSPLVCRFRLLEGEELRSRLETHPWFRKRPELLTAEALANPLVADLIRVDVENVSGGDLELCSLDGAAPLLWFDVRVEAPSGRPPAFPNAGPSGIKQLGPMTRVGDNAVVGPNVPLGRGPVAVYHDRVWKYLNGRDALALAPGRYRVTAVCSYFLPPDGRKIEVASDPLTLTITAENVRNWRALLDASERLLPDEVEESSRPETLTVF